MKNMKKLEYESLVGVMGPISWNEKDEVDGYSLYTTEDEDVILKGQNLRDVFKVFKNKRVKILGNFLPSFDNARIFEIRNTQFWGDAA